jgi:hypothetical protein
MHRNHPHQPINPDLSTDVPWCFEPAHPGPFSRALLSAPNSAHTRKLLLPSRRAVGLLNASERRCRLSSWQPHPLSRMHLPVRHAADDAPRDAPEPDSQ